MVSLDDPSINQRIKEIKDRESRATKGPWINKVETRYGKAYCDGIEPFVAHNHSEDVDCFDGEDDCPAEFIPEIITTDSGVYGPKIEDAEFITQARTDIPFLLDIIELLQEKINKD